MSSTIKLILLTLALTILMPSVANAQKRLVPCGYYIAAPEECADPDAPETCTPGKGQQYVQCNVCHIFTLTTNILDFFWYRITLPVTALMFVIGGFYLIVGPWMGKANLHTKGLTILKYTAMGLLIMFCAWIFTDTIIKVFGGKFSAEFPSGKFLPWNKIECIVPDKLVAVPPPPVPEESLCKGGQEVVDGISVCDTVTKAFLDDSIQNAEGNSLKSDRSGGCVKLDAFSSSISTAAAQYGLEESFIKAIIMVESSGREVPPPSKDNDGKSSYGIMQMRTETARSLEPSLARKSDAEVRAYLEKASNGINLGSKYLAQLCGKYKDKSNCIASYNGGPVANYDSKNCSGIKRWQCPWDSNGCWGTSKTDCTPNTRSGHPGYGVTRAYVPKVQTTQDAIKSGACAS